MLVAAVGDVHGRFDRVVRWLDALAQARGRAIDLCLAVGDVEAYALPERHRERAARRAMAPEFAGFARGEKSLGREVFFVGGNNEDFEALDAIRDGGEVASGVHFLGRAGARTLAGLRVGYLSGIYAPRFYEQPLLAPDTEATRKPWGYFRKGDVEAVRAAAPFDLLLMHEWPRGVAQPAAAKKRGESRALRAFRFPWAGNPVARELIAETAPPWVLCGHMHAPLAAQLADANARVSNVVCLDQSAASDGAVFWLEWEERRVVRAGWGVSGEVAWREGEAFDERITPMGEARPVEAEAEHAHERKARSSARTAKATAAPARAAPARASRGPGGRRSPGG